MSARPEGSTDDERPGAGARGGTAIVSSAGHYDRRIRCGARYSSVHLRGPPGFPGPSAAPRIRNSNQRSLAVASLCGAATPRQLIANLKQSPKLHRPRSLSQAGRQNLPFGRKHPRVRLPVPRTQSSPQPAPYPALPSQRPARSERQHHPSAPPTIAATHEPSASISPAPRAIPSTHNPTAIHEPCAGLKGHLSRFATSYHGFLTNFAPVRPVLRVRNP